MAENDEVRIEIGLDGGQVVQLLSSKEQWDQLRAGLEDPGNRWATVRGDDDALYVVLAEKVAYLRAVSHARRIGFTPA